ncbi:MAG: CRISPR-associated protein [Bacteroidales bacterium]|nr:CRISPR-associated protein [Bacteroidales bacterium]MDY4175170.1 CRISPR-associated protein [Bacteroidales bacterium]
MLVNISNHPSKGWSQGQIEAARREYGEVVDYPFPMVSPSATGEEVLKMAEETLKRALEMVDDEKVTLHVMGEMTLTMAIVQMARRRGLTCVASTSERVVEEGPDGQKVSYFNFVRFREYV